MKFTARQIADFLQGQVEGNPDVEVSSISKIEKGEPGTLSFLANPVYTKYIYDTKASVVIVNEDFQPEHPVPATLVRVKDAYSAFASLLDMYQQAKGRKTGISDKAAIDPSSRIGKEVYIGEFAVIGKNVVIGDRTQIYPNTVIGDNCRIGDDTCIYAGVKLYEDTVIGNECTLHAGVVLGSDGFGFAPQDDKNYKKVPQIGNVVLEDRVEIGANTTIDRATFGSTLIRRGVKLDNHIQIAHNVEIGENTVIAAQTGISGSTKIGRYCMIGGQAGFAGHLTIADEVKVSAQAGVGKNIKEKGAFVEGSPSFPIRDFKRSYIHFRKLDSIVKRIDELEKKLKDLKPSDD